MEVIHQSTNNIVAVQFCAIEKDNGDLELMRVFCSPIEPKPPEQCTIRAAERHALMEYLSRTFR